MTQTPAKPPLQFHGHVLVFSKILLPLLRPKGDVCLVDEHAVRGLDARMVLATLQLHCKSSLRPLRGIMQ